MGIELREAMRIFPFSAAKLLGGQSGLSREVTSANIQEVPDVERWLKGGEILFSAGYAFQDAAHGCAMMERLEKQNVAAVALKPGKYLPAIPAEMVQKADEIGLPLLELPENLPYMDCIVAIFERLTQKQLTVMRRVESVHDMLTQSILNKQGLEGISTTISHVFGNPVFIATPAGGLLAGKIPDTYDPDGEGYLDTMRAFLEDYFARVDAQRLRQNQCNAIPFGREGRLVVVPICAHNEHIAHLVMDTSRYELSEMDLVAFEQAGPLVAVELLNEQAVWQREQKIREQLLEDLLMRRYSDEKMVLQRGRHLGFDISGKYCLFAIDAEAFEELLSGEPGFGGDENKVQQVKSQVQQLIRTGMEAYQRPSLILDRSMGAVGMVGVRGEEDMLACAAAVEDIIASLDKLKTGLVFFAGISRVKQGIQHVEQAQREAVLAMRAGRRMHRGGTPTHTHSFGALGPLCFLCELGGSAAMRDFYEENMQALLQYDKNNNAELVKTLDCYFLCKQNLRKTADMLFVHKNSVIYRLNKIETLLGRSLDDPETSFDLQLCLKLASVF